MKRKIFFTLLSLLLCTAAFAQIAVESFNEDERDQTARVTAPRKDQNSEVCALLKIETPLLLNDMSFDFGTIGAAVGNSAQKKGEIWVYAPVGARYITIMHAQLGSLRRYEFGEPLKTATVYIMKLKRSILNITSNVPADVYVDGEHKGRTPLVIKDVPLRAKKLELKENGYGDYITTVDTQTYIKGILGTATLNITSNVPADVYVDGEHKGRAPIIVSDVTFGRKNIELRANNYKDFALPLTVTKAQRYNVYGLLKEQTTTYKSVYVFSTPDFKPFRVDFGLGYGSPFNKGHEGGILLYVEPKYEIVSQLAVGFRLDAAVFDITLTSKYATGDYYLNNARSRPFVGLGMGAVTANTNEMVYEENNESAKNYFATMLRAGFDVKHFRLTVSYNMAYAKPMLHYWGFTIGFYIGGGKR